MAFQQQYERAKLKLLTDPSICDANRQLFRDFFEFEEYKLKRRNQLRELDEPCYKTLYEYTCKLKNVNRWFDNKPWIELTAANIKQVYDDLAGR